MHTHAHTKPNNYKQVTNDKQHHNANESNRNSTQRPIKQKSKQLKTYVKTR